MAWTLVLLVLPLGLLREASGAEDTLAPAALYVRAPRSIAETVCYLESEARRIGATEVLVAFDAASFDPPPGLTEFTLEYPLFQDLPAWLHALEEWASRSTCMLRGTSSLAPRTVDLKEPGASATLTDLINSRWWEGERPAQLPSAARWMSEALARSEAAVRAKDSTPVRMLVLVACAVTPERWLQADVDKGYESEWRTKLSPVGAYFEEGRVAAALSRAACRLYVVAPEARFGDFSPLVELPELPWAARPQLPIAELRVDFGQSTRGRGRGAATGQGLREQLDEAMRDLVPDAEERRARVEELLREMPGHSDLMPPALPGSPGIRSLSGGGLRYVPTTPVWFPMIGGRVPFNNHAPSGYGIWPYARAAADTGGRYVFYPFPESRWLDACPTSPLIYDLAPELVSRAAYLDARRGDPALGVLSQASALVLDDTPWADTHHAHRATRSWTSFARMHPLQLERHVWGRCKPYDQALWGSEDGIARLGERLRDVTLPRYDDAIAMLDGALERTRSGGGPGAAGPGRIPEHPYASNPEVRGLSNRVLKGDAPREALSPEARKRLADFFERDVAPNVGGRNAEAARLFNIDRARYLRGEISEAPKSLPEWMARHGLK